MRRFGVGVAVMTTLLAAFAPGSGPNIVWMRGTHTSEVFGADSSPDGQFVASVSGSGHLRLFRREDASMARIIRVTGGGPCFMTPDSQAILAATSNGSYQHPVLLSLPSLSPIRSFSQFDSNRTLALSPEGSKFAAVSYGGVKVGSVANGQQLRSWAGHFHFASFNATGTKLLTMDYDGFAVIRNLSDGTTIQSFNTGQYPGGAFLLGDESIMATLTGDGVLRVWRVSDGELLQYVPFAGTDYVSGDLSPNGQVLAAVSGGTVHVFSTSTFSLLSSFPAPGGERCNFVDANTVLVSGEGFPKLAEYDWPSGLPTRVFDSYPQYYKGIAASPNGTSFCLNRDAGDPALVLSGADGRVVHTLDLASNDAAYSPDSSMLAVAYKDYVKVYRTSDWSLIQTLDQDTTEFNSVAFDRSASRLIVGGRKYVDMGTWTNNASTVLSYSLSDWSVIKYTSNFYQPPNYFGSILVAPDSDTVVATETDGNAYIVFASSGLQKVVAKQVTTPVYGLSPDGTQLYGYYNSSSVRFYRAVDGVQLRTLELPDGGPIVLSPDWTLLVKRTRPPQTSMDWRLSIHSVANGALLAEYDTNTDYSSSWSDVKQIAFAQSQTRIAFAGYYGTVALIVNPVPQIRTVPPSAFNVQLGRQIGGNLASLTTVDGDSLIVQKFIMAGLKGRFADVTLEAVCPFATLSAMSFELTSRVDVAGSFEQNAYLWNWTTGEWDTVDVRRDAVGTTFAPRKLDATGNLSRYVRAHDRLVRARYSVERTGPAASFVWSHFVDQANWTFSG